MLDKNPLLSAEYTYDIHLIKEILEICSILAMARKRVGLPYNENHCTNQRRHQKNIFILWAASSFSNYAFINNFLYVLNLEYRYRYSSTKNHKWFSEYCELTQNDSLEELKYKLCTAECPQEKVCYMSENYKVYDNLSNIDVVGSYRAYYFFYKQYVLPRTGWKNRPQPYWHNENYFIEQRIRIQPFNDMQKILDVRQQKRAENARISTRKKSKVLVI